MDTFVERNVTRQTTDNYKYLLFPPSRYVFDSCSMDYRIAAIVGSGALEAGSGTYSNSVAVPLHAHHTAAPSRRKQCKTARSVMLLDSGKLSRALVCSCELPVPFGRYLSPRGCRRSEAQRRQGWLQLDTKMLIMSGTTSNTFQQ